LYPTERSTAALKVVVASVRERWLPPPSPLAAVVSKKSVRAARLALTALVRSERTGRPIVIQRTATSGRARRTGITRERTRKTVRAEGRRRGRSTYECRKLPLLRMALA
jgi:hypothetical protein